MAIVTQSDFRTQVARLLDLSPDIAPINAEDAAAIDAQIQYTIAYYQQLQYITFDESSIPDFAVNPLADLVILRAASVLRTPVETLARIGGLDRAEKALLDVVTNPDEVSHTINPFGYTNGGFLSCHRYR